MLKIMKSIWIGLFVTLFLVGHVQASPGGDGGAGGTMSNPFHKDPWGDMFADFDKQTPEGLLDEFDGPSENLEQALYKVTYNGKYLTEDQRTKFYDALHNTNFYDGLVANVGHDEAIKQIVPRTGSNPTARKINGITQALYVFSLEEGSD